MKSFSKSIIFNKRLLLYSILIIAGLIIASSYVIGLNVASILDSNTDYYSREVTFSSTEGTDTIIEIVNRTKETGMASDYRNVRFLDKNNNLIPQDRRFDSNTSSVRLQLDTSEGITTIKEQWCESWEISDEILREEMVDNSHFTQDTDWMTTSVGTYDTALIIFNDDKLIFDMDLSSDTGSSYAIQTIDLTFVDNLYVNYGIEELATTENGEGKVSILIDDVEKTYVNGITSTIENIDVSLLTGNHEIKIMCSGTANDGTVSIKGFFDKVSAPSTISPTVIEIIPTYKTIELIEATLETATVTTETTVETTTEVVETTNNTVTTTTTTLLASETTHDYYIKSDDLPIAEKIYTWICSTLNLDIPHGTIESEVGNVDVIKLHMNESKQCYWYLNGIKQTTTTTNVPSITLNAESVGENTVKLTVFNSDNSTDSHKWDWNVISTSVNTSN